MEFNLNRLNNSILAFAIICVAIALVATYFVARLALADDAVERGGYTLLAFTVKAAPEDLKRHDYAFLDRYIPNVLNDLPSSFGVCYVISIDAKAVKPYEYINRAIATVRTDETALTQTHFPELRQTGVPADKVINNYQLAGSRRKIVEVVWPLTNGGALAMGFNADTLNEGEAGLRQNFVIIGLAVMFITSLGVLGLNGAVNRRVTRIIYDQQEKARAKTKVEVLAEVKKAQAVESRKADDSPLDSNEFFGLLDLAKGTGGTLEVEPILRQTIGSMVRVLGVQEVMIFMVDETGQQLQATIGHDASGIIEPTAVRDVRVKVGQGEIGSVAEYGGTTVVDVPSPGTAIVSALVSRGQVLGVFRCKNKVNGKPFGKRDKLLTRQFSELIGNALYNAFVYQHATGGTTAVGAAPAPPAPEREPEPVAPPA